MIEVRGRTDGAGRRFGIVVSRFNEGVTELLLDGARACLLEHGVAEADILIARVPGAWELPAAAQRMTRRGDLDAIVALGCVIRGETPHFEYVCAAAADGLGRVGLDAHVPVLFGVLTTDTAEQAYARAGGPHGNKGREAALAALEMADLLEQLEDADAGT